MYAYGKLCVLFADRKMTNLIRNITIPTTGLHHSGTPQCLPIGDMLLHHFRPVCTVGWYCAL